MNSHSQKCIIVGGGASGSLLALELLKKDPAILISILEPADLGRGLAYRKDAGEDLLNVPAAKMSADPDQPNEFVSYLASQNLTEKDFPYWPFVPRVNFGNYLESKLAPFLGTRLTHLKTKALRIHQVGACFQVETQSKEAIEGDFLAIATGYGVPKNPFSIRKSVEAKRTLILGSSLSAIDLWRRYRKERTITFLSRHGLLPTAHLLEPKAITLPELHGKSPLEIFSFLLKHQRKTGDAWPDIADALRPQVVAIWSKWNPKQRAQFLRHPRSYWEIIRHRVPSKIAAELEADLKSGRLRIVAGRLISVTPNPDRSQSVAYQARGESKKVLERFEEYGVASGVRIDQQLQGLDADVENGFGYRSQIQNLWLVGPASKADQWEITAVPEIRIQTQRIAQEILSSQK